MGAQSPSGGCVLKQFGGEVISLPVNQSPSGGCVLKPFFKPEGGQPRPVAFGRLCVETYHDSNEWNDLLDSRLRAAVC